MLHMSLILGRKSKTNTNHMTLNPMWHLIQSTSSYLQRIIKPISTRFAMTYKVLQLFRFIYSLWQGINHPVTEPMVAGEVSFSCQASEIMTIINFLLVNRPWGIKIEIWAETEKVVPPLSQNWRLGKAIISVDFSRFLEFCWSCTRIWISCGLPR